MRLLLRKHQCKAYKALSNILICLAKTEGNEATDAICEVYKLTGIVGGQEMLKFMYGGKPIKTSTTSAMRSWSKDEMISYIKMLEDLVERYQDMGQ